MALNIEPPPLSTPLIDKASGRLQTNWVTWLLLALLARIQSIAYVRASVVLTNQHAAIGATSLIPAAIGGVYRVTWHVRISTVDGAGSSVTVTIASSEGGNAIMQSGAAVTGDTLATVQSGSVIVTADPSSVLSYSVAYASTTPAKMGFDLAIAVEQVS